MTRTPIPGELLRAAIQPGVETAATSAQPWRATNAARGLRAIDREMLRLDAKAMAAVEDAREHIRQAEADIAGAKDVLTALGTAETDEDITLALADYLAIDPAEVSFIGSMSDAAVAKIVVTDDIVTENMIATGAVTADALNVVSSSGTGHSWRLDSTGLIAMHTASAKAMHLDSGGLRMWDASGALTVRINGIQNMLMGEFRTTPPGSGQPGVIINNTAEGNPGVWLTPDGGGGYDKPGMWLEDTGSLRIQGQRALSGNDWAWSPVEAFGGFLVYGPQASKWSHIRSDGSAFFSGNVDGHTGSFVQIRSVGTSENHIHGALIQKSAMIYENPSEATFAANLGIATAPKDRIYKLTSARRAKLDIQDLPIEGNILDVSPRDWLDRTQVEEYADALTVQRKHTPLGYLQSLDVEPGQWRRIPGLVAEEVADAGLAEFVTYDGEGRVDGLMYDRLWITLIPLVRDLTRRLDALEATP